MAWASTDIIPTSVNLNAVVSTISGVTNDIIVKLAPLNSSGTKFDFTAASAVNLDFVNNTSLPAAVQYAGTNAVTMVAHDATGLTIKVTAAVLSAMLTNLGATNPSITVTSTDGSTVLTVATGRLNYSFSA